MDDQRDYAEEAANRALLHEENIRDEGTHVGQTTELGKILSESVVWDNHDQIVTLYDNVDKEVFTVILWDVKGNYSLNEQNYPTDEEAVEIYLSWAFGM